MADCMPAIFVRFFLYRTYYTRLAAVVEWEGAANPLQGTMCVCLLVRRLT